MCGIYTSNNIIDITNSEIKINMNSPTKDNIGIKTLAEYIKITGGTTEITIIGNQAFGIEKQNTGQINMDSANVKATVTGTTVRVGILTGNGDLNIFNCSVNVNGIQKNGTDGYGIFQNYDTQNMSVKGGHIIAQGTGSAIIVKDIEKLKFNSGDDFDTKVVKASTDFDGTLGVVTDIESNYANSFEAYLKLSGRLATDVADKTVIGSITVTISE